MTRDELAWLGQQARRGGPVVELGSYLGRSTKMLALCCPGIVHSVDNLVGVGGSPFKHGSGMDARFRENMAAEIESGRLFVWREDSVGAAKFFKDGGLSMVFVDDDHTHPAPLNAIRAWLPKLKPGGLLCGHDAGFRGVKRALEQYPHELVVDGIWKLKLDS